MCLRFQIFETTSSIDESLRLLEKLQNIVYSESLKSELRTKINLIVHRYTLELTQVSDTSCAVFCVGEFTYSTALSSKSLAPGSPDSRGIREASCESTS